MTPRPLLAIAALAVLPLSACGAESVDFNRDIRPILSDTCFQCHGPDAKQRKAELRLDTADGLASVLSRDKPTESELFRRITAKDAKKRMPPAASGKTLSAAHVDLLRRWIDGGAQWKAHWSLVAPQRPTVPQPKLPVRNPIDAFIVSRLEHAGLTLSPEADRTTLLRRVTLDLTGLPPTPAEVDAFLNDPSPNAYEKVVDRLLASPRSGERMAIRWLDAARYADTAGYQNDGDVTMWRWRDWVIDAFNANMPFDRFTIEQLAGDLLPNPTMDQRIATGFNRNHRLNAEGGIIPEEYAAEYVVDRLDTTATVWLGLTLGCARCHDHKFDPFRQKEYYQLFAYFNSIPEHGRAIKYGNSPPKIVTPTREQTERLADLDRRLAAADNCFTAMEPRIRREQTAWEKSLVEAESTPWWPRSESLQYVAITEMGFDGKRFHDAGDVGDFGYDNKFTLAAWITPGEVKSGAIFSRMPEAPEAEGYGLGLIDGKLRFHLTKRWLDDALRVETRRVLEPKRRYHVVVTYDGFRLASGVRIYIDGEKQEQTVLLDELNQTFANKEPFRIGSGGGPESRFRGQIHQVSVYDDALTAEEVSWLAVARPAPSIAHIPPRRRTPAEAGKLRAQFLDTAAPAAIRDAHREVLKLRSERQRLVESFPTTMVMQELPTPRDAFVLQRGQYDKKGEKVSRNVPAAFPPLPAGGPNNRLALAKWLMLPENPLTARVSVNRLWAMLFGTGIVKTVDDFGTQGEFPSHPELLDWLAVTYREGGWDTKALLRMIVTSATYRQSSRLADRSKAIDPDNRLLSRFPRLRLSAEMIRDQALFASGLLIERQGGPSVKPYQPAGLARELGAEPYVQDTGPNLYRRGLYTYWKRTVSPPNMTMFDAAGRETCWVREARTNTPLQALTLLNDITFVEASRNLAERAVRDGITPVERIALMFRLATGRPPTTAESQILADGFVAHRDEYRKDPAKARKLLAIGESRPDSKCDVTELAAYSAVASVILNLDETITKE